MKFYRIWRNTRNRNNDIYMFLHNTSQFPHTVGQFKYSIGFIFINDMHISFAIKTQTKIFRQTDFKVPSSLSSLKSYWLSGMWMVLPVKRYNRPDIGKWKICSFKGTLLQRPQGSKCIFRKCFFFFSRMFKSL